MYFVRFRICEWYHLSRWTRSYRGFQICSMKPTHRQINTCLCYLIVTKVLTSFFRVRRLLWSNALGSGPGWIDEPWCQDEANGLLCLNPAEGKEWTLGSILASGFIVPSRPVSEIIRPSSHTKNKLVIVIGQSEGCPPQIWNTGLIFISANSRS